LTNGTITLLGWCEDLRVTCERAPENASFLSEPIASEGPLKTDDETTENDVSERDRDESTELFMRLDLAGIYYEFEDNVSSSVVSTINYAAPPQNSNDDSAGGQRWVMPLPSTQSILRMEGGKNGGSGSEGVTEIGWADGYMKRGGQEIHKEGRAWKDIWKEDGVQGHQLQERLVESLMKLNASWFPVLFHQSILAAGVPILSAVWVAGPRLCLRQDDGADTNIYIYTHIYIHIYI